MDFVSPIFDAVTRLCACCSNFLAQIHNLERDLVRLRDEMAVLRHKSEDVKRRVEDAKQKNMVPRVEVEGWLQRVSAMEKRVNEILEEGDLQAQNKCLGSCRPMNCRSKYKLSERASGTLSDVLRLADECFDNVADFIPCPPVAEIPLGYTVGLDSLYHRVCSYLPRHEAGIIGLYGTGGVGKTTLMKKINNDFLKTSQIFDTAIWVTLSKQATVTAVQEEIRNKLHIPDSIWEGANESEKAKEIFNILKTKRFVLMLDNVWHRLDLSDIGVPLPDELNGSKVIITTRLLKLCSDMDVQWKFKVECLPWNEAWNLFVKKVPEKILNSHPDIPKLAEKVAGRCKGLPLALITVGRAMANRNTPQKWEQTIQELEKSPAQISGMEDELFHVLKLSYDSLKDDITKACFIYCSLFPKEFEISNNELIEHWIGEGFFGDREIYEARGRGVQIIEDLKDACLLEERDGFEESIKMHDVIHDLALWIAQDCGKRENKFLVYEFADSVDLKRITNWNKAEKMSLTRVRNIEKLPETAQCSNLQTLFVRECTDLKAFPGGFFQSLPFIRVLDLSTTQRLTLLPEGIASLNNLEYLNLSMTSIKELPTELKNLTKLRCLLLDGIHPLIIPEQVISFLSSLQLFSMYDGTALSGYHTALLDELEDIQGMDEISLSFRDYPLLRKLLSSDKLQRCIRRLSLHDSKDLLLLRLSSLSLNNLETLVIFNCLLLRDIKINEGEEGSKGFYEPAYDIPNPDFIIRNNQHFRRLRDVKIWSCPKLFYLTCLVYVACLETLNIQSCESMMAVISNEYEASTAQHVSIFKRLTSLVLGGMPKLVSIYPGTLLFPALKVISVINCPMLLRLPFDSNSAINSLKTIEGDSTWWDGLQWEDNSIKMIFTYYFSPQYIALPINLSGEMKRKRKQMEEGSTSTQST